MSTRQNVDELSLQLFGGSFLPSLSSLPLRQMYQSRLGLSLEDALSLNQACCIECPISYQSTEVAGHPHLIAGVVVDAVGHDLEAMLVDRLNKLVHILKSAVWLVDVAAIRTIRTEPICTGYE